MAAKPEMSQIMKNKGNNQTAKNLIIALMNYGLSAMVGFFLTSYITTHISSEAYGFSNMATNFTQYIVIFTTALNYLSNRFISVSYHREKYLEAKQYFNTVLIGDLLIASACFLVSGIVILRLQEIITIPAELVDDVKITFFFTFLQFELSLIATAFGSAAYVKDRIDLSSMKGMLYTVCRISFLILLYILFPPHIYYIALAGCVAFLLSLVMDVIIKIRLLPEITISLRYFNLKCLKEVLTSGWWNTVKQLGLIMNSGFDLLILNQMVGSYEMGILAVAKTFPMAIRTGMNTVYSVFVPKQTIMYAHRDIDGLSLNILRTARILGFVMTPPLIALVAVSKSFFHLWLPGKTAQEIQVISVIFFILCAEFPINFVQVAITNVPIMYNRQKFTAIQNVTTNFISLVFTLVLLKFTNLGIYAVAGCSVILSNMGILLLYVPYCVKVIMEKPLRAICLPMYREVLKLYVFFFGGIYATRLFFADSWYLIIAQMFIIVVVLYFLMALVVLDKTDRMVLKQTVKKRIGK